MVMQLNTRWYVNVVFHTAGLKFIQFRTFSAIIFDVQKLLFIEQKSF